MGEEIKGIIEYGELEKFISVVEGLFKERNLKSEEKMLVIRMLNERELARIQQRKVSDLTANIPLGGLFKRLSKAREKEEK